MKTYSIFIREANKYGAKWNRIGQVKASCKEESIKILFKMPKIEVKKTILDHNNIGFTASIKPGYEFSVSVYE